MRLTFEQLFTLKAEFYEFLYIIFTFLTIQINSIHI